MTVRVGVIGCGIGRWHMENYTKVRGARLAAICDLDEAKLEQAAEAFGVKTTYTDYRELCAADDIDAVSVCLPNSLHAPAAVCALEHGKHLLCEKPIADSLKNARKIAAAAKKADCTAMMAMKLRYGPEATYVRSVLEKGKLGDVYYSYNSYLRPLGGIPKMGSWFTRKRFAGGGALIDNGVHLLDLTWWLMGCPKPVAADGQGYAKFGPLGKGAKGWTGGADPEAFDVEDLGVGMIRFDNGATALLDNGWATLVEPQGVMGIRLLGTQGGATLWPLRVIADKGGECVETTPDPAKLKARNQFEHFIRCIRRGEQPGSTIGQGVTILKMLDALYRSARVGRSVKIADD